MDVSRKVRGSSNNYSKKAKQNNHSQNKMNHYSHNKSNHHSQEKKLEQTTRIRIDQKRLEDSESLDTSFLEGRLSKKVNNNRSFKERLLKDDSIIDKNSIFKRVAFLCILICMIFLIISFLPSLPLKSDSKKKANEVETKEKTVERKVVLDDNYLFVGDFHTDGLDKNQFPYPIVKVCDENYQTSDLLNDMNHIFYQYNPSIIFIEIGINDLRKEIDEEEILNNYQSIIEEIQNNRPYAKIVIESLYPVNMDVEEYDSEFLDESITNKIIQDLNIKIEKIAKKMKVEYLDVYQELSDGEQLKEKYTEDGVHLNDKGNQKIVSFIQREIEDLL